MPERDSRPGGSVGEQVAAEHRRLDPLFAETSDAFRSGDQERVQRAFARLREAIEAHFDQEARLYYPAIWALRPERKDSLREFIEFHEGFRARLDQVAACLEARSLEEAGRFFQDFTVEFATHEVGEEQELRSLDEELARSLGEPG